MVVLASAFALTACIPLQPDVTPPPAPASAPPPVVVAPPPPAPQADPADLASRRFLAYHEQLRQMSPNDLGNEINRLNGLVTSNAAAASAENVLDLALALSMQHNGGDVARSLQLLEQLARTNTPELAALQPLVRLMLGRVAEQRRLEDLLAREVAQRREQQRNLQQLNEKLEALKAIERSMTTRTPTQPASAASAPPAAPKLP
ncbi:MAG TPA: hypothetical protein VFL64_16570, partial [Rhizobacter sp.]|nr:hypothetical protein [Rhizobacter sp.]